MRICWCWEERQLKLHVVWMLVRRWGSGCGHGTAREAREVLDMELERNGEVGTNRPGEGHALPVGQHEEQ